VNRLQSGISAAALAFFAGGASFVVGCAKPPPTFEEVAPADELYAQGQSDLSRETFFSFLPWVDYSNAIETFQAIIDNYPYSEYAVLAELAIADAYFDGGRFEEALSYYRDFTDLHPDNEKVPYALYQSALCHEHHARSPNRDQTPTRDALIFLDRLLSKFPYSDYAGPAETKWRELRMRMAQQVKGIGDFYMKRDEWESAAERYRSILNEYPGLGLDAQALYQLGVCYDEMNRVEEAESIYQAIVQNYRDTDLAQDAAERLAAQN